MKARTAVFRGVLILIISMIIGFSVYSWNARRLAGNRMPTPFGIGMSVVLTGSMEPTLSVDDVVIIREADRYMVDDIVVYQTPYDLVIHRIISIEEDAENGCTVITKGDANNAADDPIDISQIKGKLAFSVPHIGIVIKFLQSLPGIILVLAVAGFLMHRSWVLEKAEKDKELDAIIDEIKKLRESAEVPDGINENTAQQTERLNENTADGEPLSQTAPEAPPAETQIQGEDAK